jgi:hypothetical protein
MSALKPPKDALGVFGCGTAKGTVMNGESQAWTKADSRGGTGGIEYLYSTIRRANGLNIT